MHTHNTSPEGNGENRSQRLTFVYLQRPGDRPRIREFYAGYEQKTPEELIDTYNKAYQLGFVGVHAQGLAMIALHFIFLKVFERSPFTFESNTLLDFTGEIEGRGSSWAYPGTEEV